MFAKVKSLGIFGMDAFSVVVEADISRGVPRFDIVGLPDTAVKESRERVRAAIKNCNFQFPVSRITVNIAPADIKKEGPLYDLPVFIALLMATGQIMGEINDCAFIGELSLDGEIRPCTGVLPMLLKAREEKIGSVFIPYANKTEAGVVDGIDVFPAKTVFDVIRHLSGEAPIEPCLSALYCDYSQEPEAPYIAAKDISIKQGDSATLLAGGELQLTVSTDPVYAT